MIKLGKAFDKAITGLGILLLLAVLACLLVQVVSRYVLSSPITGGDELARFLFMWMSFLGALIGAREGSHFAVEGLASRYERTGRLVIALVSITALGMIIYGATQLIPLVMHTASPALGWKMGYVYLPITGLLVLMALEILRQAIFGKPATGKSADELI